VDPSLLFQTLETSAKQGMMVSKMLLAVVAVLPVFVYGQDLGVPLSWRVRSMSNPEVKLAHYLFSAEIQ
jgi:hypothetical protein